MTSLTHFPTVQLPDGTTAYGGSQDWFRNPWRKLSGCAAVSATNLAAYYGIGMVPDLPAPPSDASGEGTSAKAEVFSRKYYLDHMTAMFRQHMTTGMMGFPDPDKYITEFTAYAKEHDVSVTAQKQYERASVEEAISFLRERLGFDTPVVILILNHKADELDDIRWHWMTITGYDEESGDIVVSNYGRCEHYAAATVFAPEEGNQVYLISFDVTAADGMRPEQMERTLRGGSGLQERASSEE